MTEWLPFCGYAVGRRAVIRCVIVLSLLCAASLGASVTAAVFVRAVTMAISISNENPIKKASSYLIIDMLPFVT